MTLADIAGSLHDELTALVSSETGIETTRAGADQALVRFAERRVKELAISFGRYLALVRTDGGGELERLANAVTVGHTWFFRDAGQLAILEAILGSELAHGRSARVWVPGCSTGEDAYSLALVAARLRRDVEILGTDLNTLALESARRGRYRELALRELDPRSRDHFAAQPDGTFELRADVRARVTFARHNLMECPPRHQANARWDVIFCRNVLVYFTREAALRVVDALANALAPGGYLVLGAGEVVFDAPAGLEARYVANRLAFHRPAADSLAPESLPPSVDWLLPASSGRNRRGVVSAFPFGARADGPAIPRASRLPLFDEAPQDDVDELLPGHALLHRGDANAARDVYLAALERNRARADTHMYAGVARYLCGEVDPAMRDLRAALTLDDSLWPAAFYLALCQENSGHPEEALLSYRHVVRLVERGARALGSVFDSWRAELSEVAHRRVAQARLELVT
jgi:chemotaxis protein methyltransferase CheR